MALSKFTPSVTEAFLHAKADGKSHAESARAAGVSRKQVYLWIARGTLGEEPYASFVQSIESAEKKWRRDRIASIRLEYAA